MIVVTNSTPYKKLLWYLTKYQILLNSSKNIIVINKMSNSFLKKKVSNSFDVVIIVFLLIIADLIQTRSINPDKNNKIAS